MIGRYQSLETGREICSNTNFDSEISKCLDEIFDAFDKNDITVETAELILDEAKLRISELYSRAKISDLSL